MLQDQEQDMTRVRAMQKLKQEEIDQKFVFFQTEVKRIESLEKMAAERHN